MDPIIYDNTTGKSYGDFGDSFKGYLGAAHKALDLKDENHEVGDIDDILDIVQPSWRETGIIALPDL